MSKDVFVATSAAVTATLTALAVTFQQNQAGATIVAELAGLALVCWVAVAYINRRK